MSKKPWTVDENCPTFVIDADGYTVAEVEELSDVSLIAAAPELLEAVKLLLDVAPSAAPAAGLLVGIEEKHKAAIEFGRAAIAKATGEKP